MSRDAVNSGRLTSRRRSRAFVNIMFVAVLTGLFSGCMTGASRAPKFSLFSAKELEAGAGVASMEPAPVCPNCSLPVGVVADPEQASGLTSGHADGVAHQNDPAVPPVTQVPPEHTHGGTTGSMIPNNSNPTTISGPQSVPEPAVTGVPIANTDAGNAAVQQAPITHAPVIPPAQSGPMPSPHMTTTPMATGPMTAGQQMYGQPTLPTQQQAIVSPMNTAPPVQNHPGGQKTWEQLQYEKQRTQQFYHAHSQPQPPQQFVTQQMAPWQGPGCPPGMQVTAGFDGPWHVHPSPQNAMDGSACNPTVITTELLSCKEQVELLRSTVEDLKQSNDKALETVVILAEQQRRTAEENKMLRETQKAESQRQQEYYDALINAITEEEADQSSVQPDPQAATRALKSGRTGSQTVARPVSRTQTRTQPVALPAVDE